MNILNLAVALAELRLMEETGECLAALRGEFLGAGVTARLLFPELCDEALAFAIQKDFWWPEAFDELFGRRHEQSLARWFSRWRVRPQDAKDLIQDVYLKVTRNRLSNYDGRSFAAYLHTVARNRYVDHCRKRELPVTEEDPDARPGGDETPAERLVRLEERQRIEAAVGRLPEQERRVLLLGLDGEAAEEIASELGIGLRTMYNLRFKARRRLEQDLRLPSQARGYSRRGDRTEGAEGPTDREVTR